VALRTLGLSLYTFCESTPSLKAFYNPKWLRILQSRSIQLLFVDNTKALTLADGKKSIEEMGGLCQFCLFKVPPCTSLTCHRLTRNPLQQLCISISNTQFAFYCRRGLVNNDDVKYHTIMIIHASAKESLSVMQVPTRQMHSELLERRGIYINMTRSGRRMQQ
jgi:hypothetical protein